MRVSRSSTPSASVMTYLRDGVVTSIRTGSIGIDRKDNIQRLGILPTEVCDYIIVGSGIAGLRAAIALAPLGRVIILTKADPSESNTGYAQGGIAAAIGADDTPELHAADTMRAGDGLCDAAAVKILCDEGPRYVRELLDW